MSKIFINNILFLVKSFLKSAFEDFYLFFYSCAKILFEFDVISLDSKDIDDDSATFLVIGLVRMRELVCPWLSASLSLEQLIDGAISQSDQLVLS